MAARHSVSLPSPEGAATVQRLNNPAHIPPQVLQRNAPDVDGDGIRELDVSGGANPAGAADPDDLNHLPALSTFRPITPTAANSASPGAPDADPANVLSGYDRPGLGGLSVYPIDSFEAHSALVSADSPTAGATITSAEALQPQAGQIATNGTYNDGATAPAGPVFRDGDWLSTGFVASSRRGGVAQLEDGTIVVGSQLGNSVGAVQRTFGDTSPVAEFMGGGATIIRNGAAVPDAEFKKGVGVGGQHFDQPGASGDIGIDSGQLGGTAPRTLVGIRDGVAYAIVTDRDKTVPEVRDQLLAEGFTEVVVFDGGRQGYLNDPNDPSRNIDGRSATENEPAQTGFLFDVFEPVSDTPGEAGAPGRPR